MKKNCASSWLFTKIIPRFTVNRTQNIKKISVTSVLMVHVISLHSVYFGCNLCMQYPECLTEIQQWYWYKVTTTIKAQLLNFYNSLKFVFIYAFSATIPCQMQGLDFQSVLRFLECAQMSRVCLVMQIQDIEVQC